MMFNKKSYRTERVSDGLKRVIAEALLFEIKDPRLINVVITDSEISKDLKNLKIYYSIPVDSEQREIEKGLNSARGFFKKVIGEKLQLRFTPEILFYLDNSVNQGARIEKILREIKTEDEKETGNQG